MARLKEFYKSDVAPAMMSKFGYKSVMQIPKLDKVVINVGCGELKDNPKMLDAIIGDLGKITGQKAMPCKAHKSVANFKLREGMVIGAKVTLRGERMYEFVDKLFNIALPRVRDFRGINGNSFDGRGDYNLGIREQLIFPEIEYDKIDKVRGMDITFVTTAENDKDAKALLDGIISVVYASTLGIGVALSAIPIFLYQGSIALGASFLAPYLTEAVILEMKCVGSILILGLSLNMLGLTKIKVMNYVPAVFLPILDHFWQEAVRVRRARISLLFYSSKMSGRARTQQCFMSTWLSSKKPTPSAFKSST